MPSLDPRILDASCYKLVSDATDLCLCSADPLLDWTAFLGVVLARKGGFEWTEIETVDVAGRRVGIMPFVDGVWTGDGTATHYAIVDWNSEIVLATGALTAAKVGQSGQAFTTSAPLYITFPGPVPG